MSEPVFIELNITDPFSINKNRSWEISERRFLIPKDYKFYEIDLYEFTSSGDILNWFAHMFGKTWVDETKLYDLFEIINDIFNVEGMRSSILTKNQIRHKISTYLRNVK